MKLGKATGPDRMSVELLEALKDDGINKIATLLNEIYNRVQIPPDISTYIFIALPKKLRATEFEFSRMISIMSHIIKI